MTEKDKAALKPCPFDNGNAEYGFYPGEGDHCIRCKTCGASMNTRLSKDQLFERWNTRAAPAVVEPVSGAVLYEVIATETEDGLEGEPIHRLKIGVFCADFATENAALNFKGAIIRLAAAPEPEKAQGDE